MRRIDEQEQPAFGHHAEPAQTEILFAQELPSAINFTRQEIQERLWLTNDSQEIPKRENLQRKARIIQLKFSQKILSKVIRHFHVALNKLSFSRPPILEPEGNQVFFVVRDAQTKREFLVAGDLQKNEIDLRVGLL